MLMVKKDLCFGCGLCVENCPQQAISIVSATAQINQGQCNQCRRCLDVCPQGAIIEVAPVSVPELQAIVTGLKDKAEDIVARIERLAGSKDHTKQDKR
jgi:Fe-S-cluster-containing hydrogenase component 2